MAINFLQNSSTQGRLTLLRYGMDPRKTTFSTDPSATCEVAPTTPQSLTTPFYPWLDLCIRRELSKPISSKRYNHCTGSSRSSPVRSATPPGTATTFGKPRAFSTEKSDSTPGTAKASSTSAKESSAGSSSPSTHKQSPEIKVQHRHQLMFYYR